MSKTSLLLLTLATLLHTSHDVQAGGPAKSARQSKAQTQQSTKQVAKRKAVKAKARSSRPRRTMTKLHAPTLTTFGLRISSRSMADPTIGQVKGAQSSMTLTYKAQTESSNRAVSPSTKGGKSSRAAFREAERWKTVVVDEVGAHDNPGVARVSEVSKVTVPLGTPFKVSGVRKIVLRSDGSSSQRVLKNKTNTARGFAEGLPNARTPNVPKTAPFRAPGPGPWKNSLIQENSRIILQNHTWTMQSHLAGEAHPFFVAENLGISAPRNVDKSGLGTVSLLNFAAVPNGSIVKVSNTKLRDYSTSFVAGARGQKGTNRAQVKAKAGQRLRVDVQLPNGNHLTRFVSVPARGNLGEVLVRKTRRASGRYSPRYYRSRESVPLNELRVSPPMGCNGCGIKGEFVSVRVPENMNSGTVKVTNLTTGTSESINTAKVDQLNIRASLNDRLKIEGPDLNMTVFVPGARDGKLVERAHDGRPYFNVKPAPER